MARLPPAESPATTIDSGPVPARASASNAGGIRKPYRGTAFRAGTRVKRPTSVTAAVVAARIPVTRAALVADAELPSIFVNYRQLPSISVSATALRRLF